MILDLTATSVFVALFLLVTWIGFVAARWRKADLNLLHEWGLGGRRFGTVVTWFLLGGYGVIFASVPQEKLTLAPPQGDSLGAYSAYATLALGSALALFLYPHAMTGILSSSSGASTSRCTAACASAAR